MLFQERLRQSFFYFRSLNLIRMKIGEIFTEFYDFLSVIARNLYEMVDIRTVDELILNGLQDFKLAPEVCTVSFGTLGGVTNEGQNNVSAAVLSVKAGNGVSAVLCSEPFALIYEARLAIGCLL